MCVCVSQCVCVCERESETGRQTDRQTDRQSNIRQDYPTPDFIVKVTTLRGSTRRSSLKGRERAVVSQTNIGTVSKATIRKLLRDEAESIWAFQAHRYHLELN